MCVCVRACVCKMKKLFSLRPNYFILIGYLKTGRRGEGSTLSGSATGLQLEVRNRKIIFLFLIQNICCGYSKEPCK